MLLQEETKAQALQRALDDLWDQDTAVKQLTKWTISLVNACKGAQLGPVGIPTQIYRDAQCLQDDNFLLDLLEQLTDVIQPTQELHDQLQDQSRSGAERLSELLVLINSNWQLLTCYKGLKMYSFDTFDVEFEEQSPW